MTTKGYNPFDDQSAIFESVSEDEFISYDDAAAGFLDEMQKNELSINDVTLAALRQPNETFNNMTIGSYMARQSENSWNVQNTNKNELQAVDFSSDGKSSIQQEGRLPSTTIAGCMEEMHTGPNASVSFFTDANFFEMNESIPHSPPSFLQSLDSSQLMKETGSTSLVSGGIAFESDGLEKELNNISIQAKNSSPLLETMVQQSSSNFSSVFQQESAEKEEDANSKSRILKNTFIKVADSQNERAHQSNDFNLTSVTNFPSSKIQPTSPPQAMECPSSYLRSSFSKVGTVSSLSAKPAFSELVTSDQESKVGQPFSQSSVMSPEKDGAALYSVKKETSVIQTDLADDTTFNASSFNFTLTSINQMIEGGSDVGAMLADILVKKKEKITQKQSSQEKNNAEEFTHSTRHSNLLGPQGVPQSSADELCSSESFLEHSSSPLSVSSSIKDQLMNTFRQEGSSIMCTEAPSLLMCDNTVIMPHSLVDFVASTPISNQFQNLDLRQSAIYHTVSPSRVLDILDVPSTVDVPEVCCVLLSQDAQFTIRNKLKRGVKCTFSMKSTAHNGTVMDKLVCPFDIKQQVTLLPNSEETVQILFTPTYEGEFTTNMEVSAQNLTSPSETTTYEIVLSGKAEFPKLKVLPNSEVIDFGDLLWGSNDCTAIKVQNVGQATVPIRFSVIRTNSPLCSFSFQSPDSLDVSKISLTSRPDSVASVKSIPLAGVKGDGEVITNTVDLYCHLKSFDNTSEKYLENCDVFEGLLSMEVDTPIPRNRPLVQFKLRVKAGMFKLHVDKKVLLLSSLPGQIKNETLKVMNSGNISMTVDLRLEPPIAGVSLSPSQMVVKPHAFGTATLTFSPRDQTDVSTKLVLSDQMYIHHLPVTGQTRQQSTKITASSSSMLFEGVAIGDRQTKKFKFHVDQDVLINCWIQQGDKDVFRFVTEQGAEKSSMTTYVERGSRHSIDVVFSPSKMKSYSSKLVLQVAQWESFSIPLNGYGGVSRVKISGATQTATGENVVLLNNLHLESPITHRLSVTNTGVRGAFVKATIHDSSRNIISLHHATLMPSQVFLAPNETQEMILMFTPNDADKEMCGKTRALVAIIKFIYGDELARQLLIRNGSAECQKCALNYSIELTPSQKAVIDKEVGPLKVERLALNLFKASIKCKKVGLLGGADKSRIESQPSAIGTGTKQDTNTRPVLHTVNLNVQSTKTTKETWAISPASITFKVLDARSKEFAQIINYCDKDLRFFVEADDCLNVIPTKGTIGLKSWCRLEVTTSEKFWCEVNKPACALVKVKCNQETKHIRVLMEGVSGKQTFPPTFTKEEVKVLPSIHGKMTFTKTFSEENVLEPQKADTDGRKSADGSKSATTGNSRLGNNNRLQNPPSTSVATKGIQAPEMVIVPPVAPGKCNEMVYAFTNVSQQALRWKVYPVTPMSHERAMEGSQDTKEALMFGVEPEAGTLEVGGVQTVSLVFRPSTEGSYSQKWGIEYVGDELQNPRLHAFTIYAKATPRDLPAERGAPRNSSSSAPPMEQTRSQPVKPEAVHKDICVPHWTNCQPRATNTLTNSSSGSSNAAAAATASTTGSKVKRPRSISGDQSHKIIQLVDKTLQFKTLNKGQSETLFLSLKNTSPQDADIAVKVEPSSPFILRHINFSVRKDRITKLPVTFKPLHAAKFRDQVVMREKHTNAVLTAILEAECV